MSMTETVQAHEVNTPRPVIISILCVLGLIGAVASVPVLFSEAAGKVGGWYPPFLALSIIATVVSMIGLWMMRRWAVFLFTALAIAGLVIALMLGYWNTTAHLVRFAFVIVMFSQFRKMD